MTDYRQKWSERPLVGVELGSVLEAIIRDINAGREFPIVTEPYEKWALAVLTGKYDA